ncbi:hypothetical protein LINPERPRIM_LOCUS13895 [Linum perenne]
MRQCLFPQRIFQGRSYINEKGGRGPYNNIWAIVYWLR